MASLKRHFSSPENSFRKKYNTVIMFNYSDNVVIVLVFCFVFLSITFKYSSYFSIMLTLLFVLVYVPFHCTSKLIIIQAKYICIVSNYCGILNEQYIKTNNSGNKFRYIHVTTIVFLSIDIYIYIYIPYNLELPPLFY